MNEHVRIVPAGYQALPGFSSADFSTMIGLGAFEDMRVELVDGRLEKMAPAYGGHSQNNFAIARQLQDAFDDPITIGIDLALRINETTTRGIDIAVGLRDFPVGEVATADYVFLAVEIADTTLARDLGEKVVDYARVGIAHYWVVDMAGRAVHAMREPRGDGYKIREIIRFGEPLAVPGTDRTITIP